MKYKRFLALILSIVMLAVCITGCGNQQTQKSEEYTNIFEYMFSMDEEEYSYAPQGLSFGMSEEEVIKAEAFTDYTVNEFGTITYTKNVTDLTENIKELTVSKDYYFTKGYGLSKVEFRFRVSKDDVDAFWDMMKKQSEEYMPSGIEDGASEVVWGEKITFDMAKDLTSSWTTREVNQSFAAFHGDFEAEDGSGDHILFFLVGNGDSYWEFYNLFYNNFFAYAINLDHEEYTYDLGKEDQFFRFRYGDDMQSVMNGHDMLYVNVEQKENVVSMGMAFRNMPGKIKEYTFGKGLIFDENYKLTGVEYTLTVNSEELAILCDMLYEQAANYMPKPTEGSYEDIKGGGAVAWIEKEIGGENTNWVELAFDDVENGRKAVTLSIYVEE